MHRDLPPALRPPTVPLVPRIALRPDEAAQSLGICSKTLRNLEDGPAFVAIGRVRLYPVTALQSWLDSRAERPADEPVPADDLSELH